MLFLSDRIRKLSDLQVLVALGAKTPCIRPASSNMTGATAVMLSAGETMPPPNSDLATTWAFLEEGVDHIMTKLHTGLSYSKYMSLYTVSYNYCTSSRMHGNTEPAGLGGRSLSLTISFCHWI